MSNVIDLAAYRDKAKSKAPKKTDKILPPKRKSKVVGVALLSMGEVKMASAYFGGNVGGCFDPRIVLDHEFKLGKLGAAVRKVHGVSLPPEDEEIHEPPPAA